MPKKLARMVQAAGKERQVMTIECDEFEYCKVRVDYTADSDLVFEKRDEVLENLKSTNPKVSGFRQKARKTKTSKKRTAGGGKFKNSSAYEFALKKQYKKYIEEQVQKELVAEAYDETLFETKMKPVGYPQINGTRLSNDAFECEMVFLKKPDFELGEYKGFDVPEPHQEETAEVRAGKMLQSLREQHGDVSLYGADDFLQPGDSVTMDVKTTYEGEEIESLTQAGMAYTVGQNTFAEFDNNIYGMKPGEERSFDILFPDEDTINEDIRNKRVSFVVILHAGTKHMPAPLDDSLAEKLGFKTFEELQNQALSTSSAQLEKIRRQMITQQVLNRILEAHDFKVPQWLVTMEAQDAARTLGADWNKLSDDDIINLNKQSVKKVKLSMILDSIRDEEPDAVFSEEEILGKMRANISMNGGNPSEVLSSAAKDGTLVGLVAKLKDEATIQWLIEQNNIIGEGQEKKEEVDG
jgi:trigger factor